MKKYEQLQLEKNKLFENSILKEHRLKLESKIEKRSKLRCRKYYTLNTSIQTNQCEILLNKSMNMFKQCNSRDRY